MIRELVAVKRSNTHKDESAYQTDVARLSEEVVVYLFLFSSVFIWKLLVSARYSEAEKKSETLSRHEKPYDCGNASLGVPVEKLDSLHELESTNYQGVCWQDIVVPDVNYKCLALVDLCLIVVVNTGHNNYPDG
jgi:hypothetical protein